MYPVPRTGVGAGRRLILKTTGRKWKAPLRRRRLSTYEILCEPYMNTLRVCTTCVRRRDNFLGSRDIFSVLISNATSSWTLVFLPSTYAVRHCPTVHLSPTISTFDNTPDLKYSECTPSILIQLTRYQRPHSDVILLPTGCS